ncbi:hypothetical protein ABZP36_023944 [Zizania latifolia]
MNNDWIATAPLESEGLILPLTPAPCLGLAASLPPCLGLTVELLSRLRWPLVAPSPASHVPPYAFRRASSDLSPCPRHTSCPCRRCSPAGLSSRHHRPLTARPRPHRPPCAHRRHS